MTALLTILADDLTGGCDTGTLFAGRSSVPLAIWPRTLSHGDVRVIDTESRALDGGDSARRVLAAAIRTPARHVFKKVDSTLRGRIGPEIEALMLATDASSALLCPAFPAQGRVVVDRVLLIDGTPVSATPIRLDPEFPPIPEGTRRAVPDVVELLRPQFERPLAWLPLKVVRGGVEPLGERLRRLSDTVVLADAETDGDLDALVAAALNAAPGPLLVGSAGLARPFARRLGLLAERIPMPPARRWLIVAGSRHPVTRRQVAVAAAAGMSVLATPDTDGDDRLRAAKRLAEEARRVVESGGVDLVAVTGGETAVALLEALGCERVDLVGAPRAGLALGHLVASGYPSLPVLTKAGGFGPDDLFVSLARETSAQEAHV
ncbi:MAG: four-carbon acid sugar kinase family protein [Candidatus Rokuibacteriota bacterium]